MAIIYSAELHPSKLELLAAWLPSRPWFRGDASAVQARLGAFRFDDPAGEVRVETFLVGVGPAAFQVPLSYRGTPLEGAQAFLIGTTEHSVLGTRYVYDATADPVYATELAASIINAKPQAVLEHPVDGHVEILPESVEIYSKGTAANVLPELQLSAPVTEDGITWIPAGSLTLQVVRALDLSGGRPSGEIGSPDLHATWAGQDTPVLIAKA